MKFVTLDSSSSLTPSTDERNTIITLVVMAAIIVIVWHIPYVKYILWPFKLVTVAFHEFCHAFMGLLTGAKIMAIEIDPETGGATTMAGGVQCCTLPAGYVGSSLIGALLIFLWF